MDRFLFIEFWLYIQQKRTSSAQTLDSEKFVLILLKHILTDTEAVVLVKGLNFLVINPHFNMDMECTVESVTSKLPQILGMEFR
jgi:hypothetical protein